MVCLGLEPRAAEWKAQTNPLSYGDRHPWNVHDLNEQLRVNLRKYLRLETFTLNEAIYDLARLWDDQGRTKPF